jgi:C-terminal processing protease CtpA/Prc
MMTSPIVGAIGGNVLKAFRVEIDYASGETFLEQKAPLDSHDLDMVGVTLRAQPDGGYVIIGVLKLDGKDAIDGLSPGDKLIKVGDVNVSGAPLFKVVDSLRGKPDQKRMLVIERDGKQLIVKAPVLRIL